MGSPFFCSIFFKPHSREMPHACRDPAAHACHAISRTGAPSLLGSTGSHSSPETNRTSLLRPVPLHDPVQGTAVATGLIPSRSFPYGIVEPGYLISNSFPHTPAPSGGMMPSGTSVWFLPTCRLLCNSGGNPRRQSSAGRAGDRRRPFRAVRTGARAVS